MTELQIYVASTADEINAVCRTILESVEKTIPVLGLDCEWCSSLFVHLKDVKLANQDKSNDGKQAVPKESDDDGDFVDDAAASVQNPNVQNETDSSSGYAGVSDFADDMKTRSATNASQQVTSSMIATASRKKRVALLQLATVDGTVALIRLCAIGAAEVTKLADLVTLLEETKVVKAGVNIMHDRSRLLSDYDLHAASCLDLRHVYQYHRAYHGADVKKGMGLQQLADDMTGLKLDKNPKVVHSNWEADKLSDQQVKYAAMDAYAGAKILEACCKAFCRPGEPVDEKVLKKYCMNFVDLPFKQKNSSKMSKQSKSENARPKNKEGVMYSVLPKKPVYENHRLEAPDGTLLTLLGRKKIDWYLAQGIAEIVNVEDRADGSAPRLGMDEGRITVRLTFEPKAMPVGEDEYYTLEKENICVVCGADRNYLRKHIIPYGYLKYFPLVLKSHRPHDVLLLCVTCHRRAHYFDGIFKEQLALEFGAPIRCDKYTKVNFEQSAVVRAAKALANDREKRNLPPERRRELQGMLATYFTDETDFGDDMIDTALNTLREKSINPEYEPHEEKVMAKIAEQENGYEQFEQRWRQHFVDVMKPKFLPKLWSIYHNAGRRSTIQTIDAKVSEQKHIIYGSMLQFIHTRLHERWLWWGLLGLCGAIIGGQINPPRPDMPGVGAIPFFVIYSLLFAVFMLPVLQLEISLGHRLRVITSAAKKEPIPLITPLCVMYMLLTIFLIPPMAVEAGQDLAQGYRIVFRSDVQYAFRCDNAWNSPECCDYTGYENKSDFSRLCHAESNKPPAFSEYEKHWNNFANTWDSATKPISALVGTFLVLFVCSCFGPCWMSGALTIMVVLSLCIKTGIWLRFLTLPGADSFWKPDWSSIAFEFRQAYTWSAVLADMFSSTYLGTGLWLILSSFSSTKNRMRDYICMGFVFGFAVLNFFLEKSLVGSLVHFLDKMHQIDSQTLGQSRQFTATFIARFLSDGQVWGCLICINNFCMKAAKILLLTEVINTNVIRGKNLPAKFRSILVYRPFISAITIFFMAVLCFMIIFGFFGMAAWKNAYDEGAGVYRFALLVMICAEAVVHISYFFARRKKDGMQRFRIEAARTAYIFGVSLIMLVATVAEIVQQEHWQVGVWDAALFFPIYFIVLAPFCVLAIC